MTLLGYLTVLGVFTVEGGHGVFTVGVRVVQRGAGVTVYSAGTCKKLRITMVHILAMK